MIVKSDNPQIDVLILPLGEKGVITGGLPNWEKLMKGPTETNLSPDVELNRVAA
jgi:hypothetical protein